MMYYDDEETVVTRETFVDRGEDVDIVNHRLLQNLGRVLEETFNVTFTVTELLLEELETRAKQNDPVASEIDTAAYRGMINASRDQIKRLLGRP
jgi:hypothetical protein